MKLKEWFLSQNIASFSEEVALSWVESDAVISRQKKAYRAATQRLADVYAAGSVIRTHLQFYGRSLPAIFADAKAGYTASLTGKYSDRHIRNIQDVCNRFLGFLCVNGIESPDKISYSILDMYAQDLDRVNCASSMVEGLTEGFLFYLAEKSMCSYGLGWYMHFVRMGKCPVDDHFPLARVIGLAVEDGNKGYSAECVRENTPVFLAALKTFHYSQPVMNTSETVLNLLYLLLDMSGVHYSRTIAAAWISAIGQRLFKSSFGMARRALELYDDFLTTGSLNPFKRWNHTPSALELLPEWCCETVNQFLEQKRREGRQESTISSYGIAIRNL